MTSVCTLRPRIRINATQNKQNKGNKEDQSENP